MSPKEPSADEGFKFPNVNTRKPEEYVGMNKTENHCLEKLTLGLGLMCTIKPLIQCFKTFTRLRTLVINNLNFSKLHFMAIDNFLICNPVIRKLSLINLNLSNENLKVFPGTIASNKTLRSLNLSANQLKDTGAQQIAEILRSNTSLRKLRCDQNMFTTLGMIRILDSLKSNKSLVKLQAENNRFTLSRRFLAVIGDLVIYHNRHLR